MMMGDDGGLTAVDIVYYAVHGNTVSFQLGLFPIDHPDKRVSWRIEELNMDWNVVDCGSQQGVCVIDIKELNYATRYTFIVKSMTSSAFDSVVFYTGSAIPEIE